jgi:hypothetical protein
MATYRISTRFYPIRLNAFMRNEVELAIEIENSGNEPLWTQCEVVVPPAVSLAADKEVERGRINVGIINSNEIMTKKCKIFGSAKSYPDLYPIKLTVFGFGKDAAIVAREDKTAELRCERIR